VSDPFTHAAPHGRSPGGCRNPDCHTPSPGRLTLGFCEACYRRWSHAGRPDEVPEPRKGGWPIGKPRGRPATLTARQEDYAFLLSRDGGRLSPADAAERIGVSLDTVMAPGSGYEPCEPALVNEAALCAPAESCSLSQD
jgi:hypothetical protein